MIYCRRKSAHICNKEAKRRGGGTTFTDERFCFGTTTRWHATGGTKWEATRFQERYCTYGGNWCCWCVSSLMFFFWGFILNQVYLKMFRSIFLFGFLLRPWMRREKREQWQGAVGSGLLIPPSFLVLGEGIFLPTHALPLPVRWWGNLFRFFVQKSQIY